MIADSNSYERMTISMKTGVKIPLKTALSQLLETLMKLPVPALTGILVEVGSALQRFSPVEANRAILTKYPTSNNNEYEFMSIQKRVGQVEKILFTPCGLKLLNTLLVCRVDTALLPTKMTVGFSSSPFQWVNGLLLPISQFSDFSRFNVIPLVGLFLLANEVVDQAHSKANVNENSVLPDVQDYYSRTLVDPLAAVGRSFSLYNTPYFNSKLHETIGMSVEEASTVLFWLYSHLLSCDFARLDPVESFKRFKEEHREKIVKVLDYLSANLMMTSSTLDEIETCLAEEFLLDQTCRKKPFLKIDGQYICLRPWLLASTLADFPFHHLLELFTDNDALMNELTKEFGEAFEDYIELLANRAVGEMSCSKYFYKGKKLKGGTAGDRLLKFNDQIEVIIEAKSARENDKVKLGDETCVKEKFIIMNGSEKRPKGAIQLVANAEKYRLDKQYSGILYTIIAFYGRFPETKSFDDMVDKLIISNPKYQSYISKEGNRSTIWLSCISLELMFSAVYQGADLEILLDIMAN